MPPPKFTVRAWYLLSNYIFVLSVLYPLVQVPTFPLNVLATVACIGGFCFAKSVHQYGALQKLAFVVVHMAPFLWVPYDVSEKALCVAAGVVSLYFVCVHVFLGKTVLEVYTQLCREKSQKVRTVSQYLAQRYHVRV